ncbi:hypothetical protein LTR33_013705 [Friedmanniomyces endolithicus]|nr:hypothetical protein LTR33_013705 [Friedmanniomyces endolithicus]
MTDPDSPPHPTTARLSTPITLAPLPAIEEPSPNTITTDPLENLETLSQTLSTNLGLLAAWHEQSGKPYAGRKARTLRRGERRARELVGELTGLQRLGARVEEDEEVDWMGVAEGLGECSPGLGVDGGEGEVTADGDGECEEAEVQALEREAKKTGMRVPTPPPSETNEQRNPGKDIPNTQHPIVCPPATPDSHWLTLAAHDIATVSRLVVAANMLRRTLPNVAEGVEAFGLRVCGQQAWGDRVR